MNSTTDFRIAIDIGGTFTDSVLINSGSGELYFGKTLSTPADPTVGAVNGFNEVVNQAGTEGINIETCVHGSTIVPNTIIERKGCKVALITTKGFKDTLSIGREKVPGGYHMARFPPLIPPEDRLEVNERINGLGEVITVLDDNDVNELIKKLSAGNYEAIAIVLLHSYRNPSHEQKLSEMIQDVLEKVTISISSVVCPEIREYERMVTTIANAYVQPIIAQYVPSLKNRLNNIGLSGDLLLMNSGGGVQSTGMTLERPITLVESGPAGGVYVAGFFGYLAGEDEVIAFDMGGTTAKMALIQDGRPKITYDIEVARTVRFMKGSGMLLQVPSVDLIEIGAGGGSIASIDSLGLLSVGPQSAGSEPGPACYKLGGMDPTVTDAAVVLGYIGTDSFLGGDMVLDQEAAEDAILKHVGNKLGFDVITTAYGIHDLVVEQMASAVKTYVAEKGVDQQRMSLVATGGAGPVHAYLLAKKLGISKVIIGYGSGVASATGLLISPPQGERAYGYVSDLSEIDLEHITKVYKSMQAEIVEALADLSVSENEISWEPMVDLRYEGQGAQVIAPLAEEALSSTSVDEIRQSFETTYASLYGRILDGVDVQVMALRLRGSGPAIHQTHVAESLRKLNQLPREHDPLKGKRKVYFAGISGGAGRFINTDVLDRYSLRTGDVYNGPVIIEERESTFIVGPDGKVVLDEYGNIVMSLAT